MAPRPRRSSKPPGSASPAHPRGPPTALIRQAGNVAQRGISWFRRVGTAAVKEAADGLHLFKKFVSDHRYAAIWLAFTIAMAVAYGAIWSYRPDYFRVESDLNLRPIDFAASVRGHSAFGERPLPTMPSSDMQAAASQLQAAYEAVQVASGRLAADQRRLRIRAPIVAAGDRGFEASQWAQVEQYVDSKTHPFDQRISELSKLISSELNGGIPRDSPQLPSGAKSRGRDLSGAGPVYWFLQIALAEQRMGRVRRSRRS